MLKNYRKEIKELLKSDQKTMRLNRFLALRETKVMIGIAVFLIFFFTANYIINGLLNIPELFQDLENPGKYLGLRNIFFSLKNVQKFPILWGVYVILLVAVLIINLILRYQINTYWADKNYNVKQEGDAQFTPFEEIKEQYKEIPEKGKRFEGEGGAPVCCHEDKIYIDDGQANNLYLAISRGGKDEMIIYRLIDIYSRAYHQASMIITDLKMDIYPACYQTLRERGFDVYSFNLIDYKYSMRIDALKAIREAYKQGNISDAELLCTSFAYTIYNSENAEGKDSFWQKNGVSATSAMILALIDDCLKTDKMINEKRKKQWKLKHERYCLLSEEQKAEAAKIYQEKKKEKGDILDKVSYIPEEEFVPSTENEEKAHMYSMINMFTELARAHIDEDTTKLDKYFMSRPTGDRAKMKYASIEVSGDRTKGSIFSTVLSELSVFADTAIAQMMSDNTLDFKELGFGKNPVALFIGFPEYDKSKHFIVTVILQQIYFTLAKEATKREGQKCERRVVGIFNEFGSFPVWRDLDNIITMNLSRNIYFNFFLQTYEQMDKYGKSAADTIIKNCSNQMYILSSSWDTAETFSKSIGADTITDVTRMGNKLELKKNITESFKGRRLLDANQLMELMEGECVLKRTTKRRDLKGNPIRPRPIFNSRQTNTHFKYRYEYMLDDFPQNKTYTMVGPPPNQEIDMKDITWNPETSFNMYVNPKIYIQDLKMYESVMSILWKELGEEAADISPETTTDEIYEFIDEEDFDENVKKALYHLIEMGV